MNFKTTLILIGLLAIVLGVVLIDKLRTAEPPKVDAQGQKLFTLDSAHVNHILISAPQAKIELSKSGGQWRITKPLQWPADASAIDSLISRTLDLHLSQQATQTPAEAGLDKPRYTIDLTDDSGKTESVKIGKRTSLGRQLFVQGPDASAVYLASNDLADTLYPADPEAAASPVDSIIQGLRARQLSSPDIDALKQLQIQTADGLNALFHKDDAGWHMDAPFSFQVDSEVMEEILSATINPQIEKFLSPASPGVKAAHFEAPQVVVSASTSAAGAGFGAAATQPGAGISAADLQSGMVVKFGQLGLDREHITLMTGQPPVYAQTRLSNRQWSLLTQALPIDLRDRNVLSLKELAIASIDIHPAVAHDPSTKPAKLASLHIVPATTSPAATSQSQPSVQKRWVVADPSGAAVKMNDQQVDRLIGQLSPLRVEKYIERQSTTRPSGSQIAIDIEAADSTARPVRVHLLVMDPGQQQPVVGEYKGLWFEMPYGLIDDLRRLGALPKAPQPQMPNMPPSSFEPPQGF